MVPRSSHDAALDAVARLEKEAERLQRSLEGVSSDSAADLIALQAEVGKLRREKETMVRRRAREGEREGGSERGDHGEKRGGQLRREKETMVRRGGGRERGR